MKTSESITEIAKALVQAQSAMGAVTKDSKNPFFKSSYATLNAVREAAMPSLIANGLTLLQPTVSRDGKLFVETVILHTSGEFISGETEAIISKANDAQSAGSAISYARRYGMMSLLGLAAEDDDGNAATGKSTPNSTEDKQGPVATKTAATVVPASAPVTKKVTFSKKAATTTSSGGSEDLI